MSITYMTDPGTTGLGAFVDDATVTAGAASATTSFEDGLGGWTVPGAPADSGPNSTDWIRSRAVGYVDGPGVGTDHSVYLGFGPEGVTGAANRARLLGDALRYLGVGGG